MSTLTRAATSYWRWSVRVWCGIRRFSVPIVASAGVGTVILWARGVDTGNVLLMWAPAAYGTIWFLATLPTRRG